MQVEGNVTHNYRYCHTAYVLNIPIKCYSDLDERQFKMLCDGKFNREQIVRFEIYGMF